MNVKNRLAALVSSFLMLTASITPVLAKTAVYEDYDTSRLGSITLYKYVSNDGAYAESTGASLANTADEQLAAVQKATGNYRMIPEKGVEFMYKKVGNYEQVNASNKSGMYITDLDQGFYDLITKTYGITLTSSTYTSETDNGVSDVEKHYDVADVTDAMTALAKASGNASSSATGEEAVRAYVKASGNAFDGATNSYGKTAAKDLPIGLYLVSEIDWEHQTIAKHDTYWERTEDGTEDAGEGSATAEIVSPSSPFLVQIPLNNVTAMESGGKTFSSGEGWIYDVTAYPKNGSLGLHKDIVVDEYSTTHNNGNDTSDVESLCDYAQVNYINENTGGIYEEGIDDDTKLDGDNTHSSLTHQIDVNIGDTVTNVISSDVPALIGEKVNKTYKITDRLTNGLTFKNLVDVKLGTDVWDSTSNVSLVKDTDYTLTVENDGHSFTIDLTENGLKKLDNIQSASYLYIVYDSVLNKDAQIGIDTYSYTTNDSNTIDATNQGTAMLTYATDRTSEHDYYSNTTRVYSYEIDLAKNFSSGENLDYSEVAYKVEGSYQDALNVDHSLNAEDRTYETLSFVDEGNGVYHVYDEITDDANAKTEEVHPDKTTGNLVLKGVDSRDYRLTETKTISGYNLMAESIYMRLEANMAGDVKFEDGSLDHAYFWSGNEPLSLKKYDILNSKNGEFLASGRAKGELLNNESIYILRTGSDGTVAYGIIGGALLLLGLAFFCRKECMKGEN